MDKFLEETIKYFESELEKHGPSALGVNYNSPEAQSVRFAQIFKLFDLDRPFSVLDYGCGIGNFYEYLTHRAKDFDYTGFDLSQMMLKAGRAMFAGRGNCHFTDKMPADNSFDYTVAISILNNKVSKPDEEWSAHVMERLMDFNRLSKKGFAFNALSTYSDIEKRRADLFYSDPLALFDFCKRNFSRNVALLHDYGLWDFTIIVRKEG